MYLSGAGGNQNGAQIKVTVGPTFVSLAQTGLSKCVQYQKNPVDSSEAVGHWNKNDPLLDQTSRSSNFVANISGVRNLVKL